MNSKHTSSLPNPHDISYNAYTNSEERCPLSLPKPELPVFNLGVDNGTSKLGEAGGSNITKPPGRPRGSKNKPKGDVLERTPGIKVTVLEIPPGVDIVEWLGQLAQSKKAVVNVLGGFGLLSEVVMCLGSQPHPVIFSEPITLMSISGFSRMVSPSESVSSSFAAVLGRLNGTAIAGPVYRLVTVRHVVVNAIVSNDAEFIGDVSKSLA